MKLSEVLGLFMRMRLSIFVILLSISFFLGASVFASEKIQSYDVHITMNHDSSIDIQEVILYDFGDVQRHGIYRDIPLRYNDKIGNYRLKISDIQIVDENGDNYTTKITKNFDEASIRIGDAHTTISGQKTYIISYTIERGIRFFEKHDELFWNAIGNGWKVPILSASATVDLPEEFPTRRIDYDCYYGPPKSRDHCDGAGEITSDVVKTIVFNTQNLNPFDGMSVAIAIPKGFISEPTPLERFMDFLRDNLVLLVPILLFVGMLIHWYRRGRDPRGKRTIIVQFDPPQDLSPSEVGTIFDEFVHGKDITADILQLAVLGYIRIRREETKRFLGKDVEYTLIKLKEGDDLEHFALNKLFSDLFAYAKTMKIEKKEVEAVKMSDLKTKFASDYRNLQKQIYKQLVQKGFYVKNPAKIRSIYIVLAIVLGWISFAFFPIFGVTYVIAGITSAGIMCIFAFLMPKRTYKGVLTKEHILGLKQYLQVAEKDRLEFHHAPKKEPKEFDRLLPFAIALGVEEQWSKQFATIYTEAPNWYEDTSGKSFSFGYFVGSLHTFQSSAQTNLSTPASTSSASSSGFSSSGGFSGGGFGGGGGGSW